VPTAEAQVAMAHKWRVVDIGCATANTMVALHRRG
jgi:hypothetical protein